MADEKTPAKDTKPKEDPLVAAKINPRLPAVTGEVRIDGHVIYRGKTRKVPAALLDRLNEHGLQYLVRA